jgi:hypothetical protein
MWKDPIVEEIHAVREQISRECGDDLAMIMARLRKNEATTPGKLVAKEELLGGSVVDSPNGCNEQDAIMLPEN